MLKPCVIIRMIHIEFTDLGLRRPTQDFYNFHSIAPRHMHCLKEDRRAQCLRPSIGPHEVESEDLLVAITTPPLQDVQLPCPPDSRRVGVDC